MRRLAVVAILAPLALTACSSGQEASEPVTVLTTIIETSTADAPAEEEAPTQEPEAEASVADAYGAVLDNPTTHPADDQARFVPTGTHSYALAEVNGDGTPEMLLKVDSKEFARVHVVFMHDDGTAATSSSYIIDGAAGAGGGRARVDASQAGNGVWETDWQSIGPEYTSTKYVLEGNKLVPTEKTTFPMGTTYGDHAQVQWIPSTDRSGLAGL